MEVNRVSRFKMLASLAVLGFAIGVVTYLTFNWLATFVTFPVAAIPIYIPRILIAPWFLSGLAGSIFTLVIVIVIAYVTTNKD